MYRKTSVFNFSLNNIKPYLPFSIFSLIFLVGILIGSVLVGRVRGYFDFSCGIFEDIYNLRSSASFYPIIKDSLLKIFLPYIALFLFGTSIVGFVFIPVIVATLGLRFGLLTGYLYITHNLNGIMFTGLILLPSATVFLFGVVLLSIEAFHFSKTLSTICIKSNKPINIYSEFKVYSIKSVATLVAALVSVILDVGMASLFINYFNFWDKGC